MFIINKKELGKFGENVAAEYLEKIGYEIVGRNFYCRQGEIDIIAIDNKEVVFVEVKTRSSNRFGNPAEAVDWRKQVHMVKAAKYFLFKQNLFNYFVRFDVVEVLVRNGGFNINHIKQIF